MNNNSPFLRHQRVAELIKKELSQIILQEIEFDSLVTITGTDVSKKLDFAKIYIGVIPAEKDEEALKTLKKRRPYLQSLLLKKINIHPMPTIEFYSDKGNKNSANIEKLLLKEDLES